MKTVKTGSKTTNGNDTNGTSKWMGEIAAAEYIGRSVWALRNWRKDGKIVSRHGTEPAPRSYRRGGHYYYDRAELDAWIRGGQTEVA